MKNESKNSAKSVTNVSKQLSVSMTFHALANTDSSQPEPSRLLHSCRRSPGLVLFPVLLELGPALVEHQFCCRQLALDVLPAGSDGGHAARHGRLQRPHPQQPDQTRVLRARLLHGGCQLQRGRGQLLYTDRLMGGQLSQLGR